MRRDPRYVVMTISLLVSILMVAGKLTAFFLTHSSVVLSDAAESVVHGVATGFAAFSLWYASKPPDANHPYGHGRIAYLSVGFEGLLVLIAALSVIAMGIDGLLTGPDLRHLGIGLWIAAGLAMVNLGLGVMLIRVGKTYNSVVLISNGKHVFSDMWTTVAAIGGLGLVMLTGLKLLDPIFAILVGGYILWSGASLLRRSLAGLMDELDPALANRILDRLELFVHQGVIEGYHQLRCRRLDEHIWVEVHLLVNGSMRVTEAHTRATRIESAIEELFPNTSVVVGTHVEPDDHEAAHPMGHEDGSGPLTLEDSPL